MNGKIHGKQIRDNSIDLLKLDLTGSQGTFLFGTGSYLGTYEVPNIPQAFVTKQYVDSLSSGLDPKESVYLVAVSNLTTIGEQVIDGVTASVGKRVLLTAQSNPVDNGIYIVSTGSWTRASDSDGDPINEVSLGNYTFVEKGASYSSTGWILYNTDATGSTISPGVNTQLWTQFNGAGSFIWGDGLANTGNNIYVDLDPNSGLTFSTTGKLKIADYAAGDGLTITNGVINVEAGNGIAVSANTVDIDYIQASQELKGNGLTASSGKLRIIGGTGISVGTDDISVDLASVSQIIAGAGLTSNGNVLDIGQGNGITVNYDSIQVNYTEVAIGLEGDGLTASGGKINVNTSNGLTVVNDSVQLADTVAGDGLTFSGGVININGSTAIGVNSDSIYVKYDPNTISIDGNGALTVISAGDAILDIIAGRGISGSQLSGPTASLDVELTENGGLTFSGTGANSTIQVDYTTVAAQLAGNGLTNNGTTIDVGAGAGISVNTNNIAINLAANSGLNTTSGLSIDSSAAGNGLSFTNGAFDINVVKGVTISGDALFADADTILTTTNLSNINIASGSSVQSALTAIDNKLSNVGAQQMVCESNNVTGTFLKVINIPQDVLGVTFSTASDGCPSIFINGAYVKPSSATVSVVAYFSTDGGNTGTETVEVGSRLYINVNQLNYNLDSNDTITVHYLTRLV